MSASQLQRLLSTATAVALAGCGASQTGGVDATVWQAVERGDVAAVAKNLGGPSLANSTNTAGNSLLYEAVASPDLAVARLLLAMARMRISETSLAEPRCIGPPTKTGLRSCDCFWPRARM